MTAFVPIARPYARATFEYAQEQQQLHTWQVELTKLKQIVSTPAVTKLLQNPKFTTEQHLSLLTDLAAEKDLPVSILNLLKLLAQHHRLLLLPTIADLFAEFYAESQKIIDVQVSSAIQLTEDYKKKLAEQLEKKLERNVKLHCEINPDIIGGLFIRAGDWVMDSSIRGELTRLRRALNL